MKSEAKENQQKNSSIKIETDYKKTWCPGCTNYALFHAYKAAIAELINDGKLRREQIVLATGIGCHGKVHDYLGLTSINGLHGRIVPLLTGIKMAKPELKVIGISGDGDSYDEGLEHLIHAARRNVDMTLIIHNNQVFALTTGQHTAVTQQGFLSKSLRNPTKDMPLNPIKLMLSVDASFVARCYALEINHTKEVLKEAIMHKGFSFVEVLQPCIVFNDTRQYIEKRIYKLDSGKSKNNLEKNKSENFENFKKAWEKACEWNYNFDENSRIAIGIFYKKQRPIF